VGKNFAPDRAALPAQPPALPILFHKPARCVVGPEADVQLPPGITRIKFEAELAVVIGRRARGVSAVAALGHVCGYTVANDFAALELFHPDGHWTLGKSCDTFCPLGPVIATELDLSAVRVRSFLNGQPQQDSALDLMITALPRLIELISRYLTLEPGDVILTGTPSGAAFAADGDVVECAINGIGRLRNPVRRAPGAAALQPD
jgi:2-keto-4-pentenoate hydratase/2-oxohepta-3-ene-1,7-dioic acid hydratase in catechol pathway